MRKFVAMLAGAIGLAQVGAAAAEELRLLTSWDTSYAPVEAVIDPLMDKITEATDGALTVTRFGPETIPPFEQLDPVARGAFDLLVTNGAYHYNQTAASMALEALTADSASLRSSGIFEAVDAHYQTLGLKLIGFLYDHGGYHIMLRQPLGKGLFEGLRIRGTPVYHPVIEALGGAPVVLPASEIYPSLERGVVEGAAWPTIGAVGFRWFEVADYMMRPSFGLGGYPVLMNLDRWNSLDEATQEKILQAVEAYEPEAAQRFAEVGAAESETLAQEGMEITQLPEDIVPVVNKAWYEGVMALSEQQDPELIAEVKRLGAEAGLTP
ncbi:C4-dicarboxylate ABC transporter substrate-binding protein [Paracoccus subflavus]|uniref:C4-dicarboxylate ABC transporter substrate-binding protein n=1 Tax=Paracoccus subflavus TaxID=2528244 RepID=A0A4Q9FV83_9RHOB|nr:TRAP transporter substrate-binding protein DctP [Paracoccus subflavus]TBN36355.1 C4-dicarboxylate ABC transporter substrate-binding protein [Paracoccus subflavus]